jgi:hypothetical protein
MFPRSPMFQTGQAPTRRGGLECGSSSYRLPTPVHTAKLARAKSERRQLLQPHSKMFTATVVGEPSKSFPFFEAATVHLRQPCFVVLHQGNNGDMLRYWAPYCKCSSRKSDSRFRWRTASGRFSNSHWRSRSLRGGRWLVGTVTSLYTFRVAGGYEHQSSFVRKPV